MTINCCRPPSPPAVRYPTIKVGDGGGGSQAPPPASADQPRPAEPGMIPLTVPEIKRLLAARSCGPARRPHRALDLLDTPPSGRFPLGTTSGLDSP